MYRGKKTAAIIAAAGKGTRLGGPVPKQYLDINGEPMLAKTLRRFSDADEIDHIIVVTNEEYVGCCGSIANRYGIEKMTAVTAGGAQRQDSVWNALKTLEDKCPDTGYVLVHDGARPFVSHRVIRNVLEAAADSGAATACVPVKDSLRRLDDDGISSSGVDRSMYFSVQTPQGFRLETLKKAYQKAFAEGFYGTDDAVLAERAGYPVTLVEGEYGNIKITTREDMPMENRTGTGFDVHAFAPGRKLILGGVEIPYDRGLDGHSDADVLVHALMDALLGAAAMGDIGRHFPDTDQQYKGISSMVLLRQVGEKLAEAGYSIVNADVTVMAQAPKISPYIDEMRSNIAGTLNVDKSRINIKGTTTERLGFVGRKEGIAAEAVCSISR